MMKSIQFPNVPLQSIQHSVPYNKIDSTQAWYTFLLVFKVKFLSLKSGLFKAPKAWDALIIRLSTSHTHTNTHTHIHTHIHTYTHTYTHTHVHTRTHTQTLLFHMIT